MDSGQLEFWLQPVAAIGLLLRLPPKPPQGGTPAVGVPASAVLESQWEDGLPGRPGEMKARSTARLSCLRLIETESRLPGGAEVWRLQRRGAARVERNSELSRERGRVSWEGRLTDGLEGRPTRGGALFHARLESNRPEVR